MLLFGNYEMFLCQQLINEHERPLDGLFLQGKDPDAIHLQLYNNVSTGLAIPNYCLLN